MSQFSFKVYLLIRRTRKSILILKGIVLLLVFTDIQIVKAQLNYQRTFAPDTIVNVGEPIQVTIQLINQSTDTLKGLVYSEQIPVNIHFTPVSAQINNQPYTGVILEQGNSSAVCNNHYPQRWIFQTPPSFPLAGSILPGDEVQIRYELTAISDTIFPFNNDAWYGGQTAGDTLRPVFGFDSLHSVHLSFIPTTTNRPPVVSDIPDQTIGSGSSFAPIALDDYVTDPDHTDDQIVWSWSGNVNLTVNIDTNRIASFTIPNSSWTGSETVTFIATDPEGLSDNDAANFTVQEVINFPPGKVQGLSVDP